ncbi:DUF5908 family protein [Serratia marcescens]|uniref:DUF5908 family protein n=1 Tax=Serratia marcescens TaxID=615 RepID=UPI000A9E8116|nr:DUF5908 family protein [Serratia marcescens]UJA53670.1 DUF5908 family protein [Serratia marcescens]
MLEIRELVIEARVVDDTQAIHQNVMRPGVADVELARWVELISRRVLDVLHEQRERE